MKRIELRNRGWGEVEGMVWKGMVRIHINWSQWSWGYDKVGSIRCHINSCHALRCIYHIKEYVMFPVPSLFSIAVRLKVVSSNAIISADNPPSVSLSSSKKIHRCFVFQLANWSAPVPRGWWTWDKWTVRRQTYSQTNSQTDSQTDTNSHAVRKSDRKTGRPSVGTFRYSL